VDDVNQLGWPRSDVQASELGDDERLQIDPAREAAHYKKMYDRVSALAKIGVWECDLATEQLRWTDTVYDLFEIPRGAAIRRTEILELYEPESRREMERLRAEAIRTGTGSTLDIRIRTALGNERWIRLSADVEKEDGRGVRIFGTKQDISRERAAQEKVQALQTELIHVSRVSAMSTMASTLAHELNQPLTAVASYMAGARRMLAKGPVGPELSECVESAGEAALRAGEIIRRLRDMTVRGECRKEELDVRRVVLEAVALATAGDPSITLSFDFGRTASLKADRLQVQQVLFNLIRNACEAAAGKRCHVEIKTKCTDDELEIHVSDSGPGIPAEILPNVFESLVTTKAQGMGIGLSICQTIIEAHGGHIVARNRPEGGATVCFTLPLMHN
jgi:two-component system, LuxR family, sensor kinase FixL